jgi:hypothetical protein
VAPAPLAARGEPEPRLVRALTGQVQAGLDALVLQAESEGALRLAAGAEQVLSEGDGGSLAERVELRQRLLAGRTWLAAHDPARLEGLERRLRRHLALLEATRLEGPGLARLRAATVARGLLHLLLAPLALAGVLLHFAAWHAVDLLAHRSARGDQSMEATLKLGFGLVLYPVTWIAAGVVVGLRLGAGAGLLAGVAGSLLAAAAVAFDEGSEPVRILARAALLRLLGHRGALSRLRAEREALRGELLAAAALVPPKD